MFGLTVLHMPCCSLLTKIRRLQLFFQSRVFICPFPPPLLFSYSCSCSLRFFRNFSKTMFCNM